MKAKGITFFILSLIIMVISCASQKSSISYYKTIEGKEKPTIAVIPFHSDIISKAESNAITLLFETALQEIGLFNLVEQTQLNEILVAQEYSLTDCTDESCAVKIGKLIAAEHIVLGAVLEVGSKYYINVKIIDVQTGINLSSEKISCNTINSLASVVDPLANRLVGFEYKWEDIKDEPEEVVLDEKILPVEEPAKEKRLNRMQKNYFSSGAGFGFRIPVGDVAEVMDIGYSTIAFFNYNIVYDWGLIGIGVLAGIDIQLTNTDVLYQYDLFSIPIAINIKYSSNFDFPLYAYIEMAGGISVNMLIYKEIYENKENITANKYFLVPTIGAGYYFMPELSLSIYCSYMVIFFDNYVYIGISPGLKFEYNFEL